MAVLLCEHAAAGGPGIEPRWMRSDKDGVGTAYSVSSQVWFTISKGILNEVYYPTIDQPQVRDLQYLMTDGKTFFCDERHLDNTHACLAPYTLGYRITNTDPKQRYRRRSTCRIQLPSKPWRTSTGEPGSGGVRGSPSSVTGAKGSRCLNWEWARLPPSTSTSLAAIRRRANCEAKGAEVKGPHRSTVLRAR